MDRFVVQANIDHYLDLLKDGDVSGHRRSTIHKLLVEEEGKLGHGLEQLEFAQSRAAKCRSQADRQRRLLTSLDHGSRDRALAESLLVNFESLAQWVEHYCHDLRRRMNESGL